jgi:hypothetical protein
MSSGIANGQQESFQPSTNAMPLSADTPIPSIEDLPSPNRPKSPLRDAARHQRTPSLSLSSSDSASSATIFTPSATPTPASDIIYGGHRVSSIDVQLQDMQLRDPYRMSEVANAIDGCTPENSPPRSLLSPDAPNGHASPSPSRRSPLRHRSSSRVAEGPHDINDEEPPNDRFHQRDFQVSFASAKALMQDLGQTLGSSGLSNEQDSMMKKLHERSRALARYECPQTRTVGFVGDSGVGKSRLTS